MNRPLRIEYQGALYHVMSHGTGILWLYRDALNFKNFIELLQRVKLKYGFIFHTFILMQNHYHMLLETPQGNLSRGMLYFNRELARAYNRHFKRHGAVLSKRYKAILIESGSYYNNVFRYINQNAMRKGVTDRVENYMGSPWYYLTKAKECNNLCDEIREVISWKVLKSHLGTEEISKIITWLNEDEESAPKIHEKYNSILGSDKWIKEIREKYISGQYISDEIVQSTKLRMDNSDIWKMFRALKDYKDHKKYRDIVIFLLSKHCDLTQKEIAEKVGIKSGNAVGVRLFRFGKLLQEDRELAAEVERIEKCKM